MAKKTNTKTPVPQHSQRGKFVYKPIKSTITLCSCGNKYVITRPRQIVCIECLKSE